MKITAFLVAVAILCTGFSAFAQHSLQLDDGSALGHYSLILPQTTDVGVDKYQLPANGGTTSTIVTIGGGGTVSNSWLQGGNNNAAITGYGTLGTRDAVNLTLITSNTARMTILAGGNIGIGVSNPGSLLSNVGNVATNVTDQAGNGLQSNSINWQLPGPNSGGGYILGLQNNDAAGVTPNPYGLIVKTRGTISAVRVLTLNSGAGNGIDLFQVFGDGSMQAASNNLTVSAGGDITKIKNVSYVWPAAQAVGTKVLQNDGAGNLSWAAGGGGGTGQPKFVINGQNANYTVLTTDQLVQVNTNAGNVNITLPNANTFSAGQTIVIKNVDPGQVGNSVTIKTTNAVLGDNGQKIDDVAPAGWFGNPIGDDQVQRLYSDGVSNWYSW